MAKHLGLLGGKISGVQFAFGCSQEEAKIEALRVLGHVLGTELY